jgi:plastocyanin
VHVSLLNVLHSLHGTYVVYKSPSACLSRLLAYMFHLLISLYFLSLANASVNLEFQVDGNTSDSSFDIAVKYDPAEAEASRSTELPKSISLPSPFVPTTSIGKHYGPISTSKQRIVTTLPVNKVVTTAATPVFTTSPQVVSGPRTHIVNVGASGKLIFSPNSVDAAVGDIIHFQFLALNHTLTQSTLSNPCVSTENFDTEFTHFNPSNRTDDSLMFLVQSTNPQWFFCRQLRRSSHCSAGMVFGLNPGTKMDEFLVNAQRALPLPTISVTSKTTAENSALTTQSEGKKATAQPSTVPVSVQTTQMQSEAMVTSGQVLPVQVITQISGSIMSSLEIKPSESSFGIFPPTKTTTNPLPDTATVTSSPKTMPTVAVSVVSRDEKIIPSPFLGSAARHKPRLGWYAAVLLAVIAARRLVKSAA